MRYAIPIRYLLASSCASSESGRISWSHRCRVLKTERIRREGFFSCHANPHIQTRTETGIAGHRDVGPLTVICLVWSVAFQGYTYGICKISDQAPRNKKNKQPLRKIRQSSSRDEVAWMSFTNFDFSQLNFLSWWCWCPCTWNYKVIPTALIPGLLQGQPHVNKRSHSFRGLCHATRFFCKTLESMGRACWVTGRAWAWLSCSFDDEVFNEDSQRTLRIHFCDSAIVVKWGRHWHSVKQQSS